ncbi:MAG: hypothetical protein NUV77_13580 [Thermoguttaceae bacterium]|jgi:hypothetical protein|nr:hypothetical protein [Thermoguttaceae bacterium]
MPWLDETLDRLADKPVCGYRPGAPPAVEPTALAAMALAAHRRMSPAGQALGWLAEIQSSDGSLGIDAAHRTPKWPTGWGVLAWSVIDAAAQPSPSPWHAQAARGVAWLLATEGKREQAAPLLGHDVDLVGWPWVEGTHSWLEPTAIALLALKAAGLGDHARCREAVRLIVDRMLPSGGWNYGNTMVLGNVTQPNVQSTGLALAALVGEAIEPARLRPSIEWLRRTLSPSTTTISLGYAVLGLAGHAASPDEASQWLAAAYHRTLQRGASPYALAVAALAALGAACPWYRRDHRPPVTRHGTKAEPCSCTPAAREVAHG